MAGAAQSIRAMMISFDILGPLEVRVDEDRIQIAGPKKRSLFAVLLLRHGDVVPVEDLVAELWRDDPPRQAANALHAHASRLRMSIMRWRERHGLEISLQTRYPGYCLQVPADAIDAVRFEKLDAAANTLKSAEPDKALALLREALALWRGPALQDVPRGPIRDQAAQLLESRRMLTTASLIEINLDLGRHVEIIPQLEALVLQNPLEERLYSQLMVALHRAGRPADALGIYQLARVSFAKEIGLSPSPALERQMLAILNRSTR
ncbi:MULTISPECIES: AfsR/SARP family transcriptional regulator [unclassified Nonomuraea]|uniref:AfsR/SARP family transcriptional regulator n=1 Tax=unclassified Nonomuraea TaxID=2593643 RepID=UPI0033C9604C